MIDFRFISIIKLIEHFTFAVNQENFEINLRVKRVLTDYNKNLSRATDKDGIVFFFGVGPNQNLRGLRTETPTADHQSSHLELSAVHICYSQLDV